MLQDVTPNDDSQDRGRYMFTAGYRYGRDSVLRLLAPHWDTWLAHLTREIPCTAECRHK